MRSFIPWISPLGERIIEKLASDGAAILWHVRFELISTASPGHMAE